MKHLKRTEASKYNPPIGSPHWIKATIVYREINHLALGLGLAAHLQLEGHAKLIYFARYTSPPYRLEVQLYTHLSMATLRKAILEYRPFIKPLRVTFEKCNGSVAHALAFSSVMTLAAENQLTAGMLMDIFHWCLNMSGFSYVQEAAFMAMQAHTALRNVPGWTNAPIFSQHALKTKMQKVRAHPARR